VKIPDAPGAVKGSRRNGHFARGKARFGCELSQKTCLPRRFMMDLESPHHRFGVGFFYQENKGSLE